MALGLKDFSNFVLCLSNQAQVTESVDLAAWAVEHLSHIVGFDCAWYGWAEIADNKASIRAQSTINLPDDYYHFWQSIAADDLLVRKISTNPFKAATYERADGRQTEGMAALSDRYQLSKIACSMAWRSHGATSFFISTYRSGRSAHPFDEKEIDFLQCAADQVAKAMRRSLIESQTRSNSGAATMFVNEDGVGLLGLDEFRSQFGQLWPDWKGDLLPSQLRSLALVPGQHYLIDRGLSVTSLPHPNRGSMPLYQLSVRTMNGLDLLTEREREVAGLLADGKSHKEAARLLGVAPSTVRNQTQTIYCKLQINNRASLASMHDALRKT